MVDVEEIDLKNVNLEKYDKKVGDSKDFVCVICPNSCRLHVEVGPTGEVDVQGYQCKRGFEYGIQEFLQPIRMLITTMKIENGVLPVIPVRSNKEVPRERIFDAIEVVNQTVAQAPVKMGDILVDNLLDLGIHVIASRDMEAK
ncbi:MAG: DUF1667 domain-containing protein [Candidatus Lokiarchaeota archaeon]|nr:DUF1667 domain-containing protein [Candidatus Lokiarchaeota archaeon]